MRRKASGHIPPDVLVQCVASTFILVLNWWVESETPLRPKSMTCFAGSFCQRWQLHGRQGGYLKIEGGIRVNRLALRQVPALTNT